jgi:hypothetical protein
VRAAYQDKFSQEGGKSPDWDRLVLCGDEKGDGGGDIGPFVGGDAVGHGGGIGDKA